MSHSRASSVWPSSPSASPCWPATDGPAFGGHSTGSGDRVTPVWCPRGTRPGPQPPTPSCQDVQLSGWCGTGVAGARHGGEDRCEVGAAFGIGKGEDLVTGAQDGGAMHRDELVVADHEADPDVFAHLQVADAAAVGWGAGRHEVAVQAAGLVAEPHPEAPRFGFHGPYRHPQSGGYRGYQAALDDDGEGHYDHDDGIQPRRVRDTGGEQEAAEQDRDGALEPGPEHKQPLTPGQPDRHQQQPDPQGADHHGQQPGQDQADPQRAAVGQGMETDGKAEDDKGHDLGQAGQGTVEPLDLPLVGARASPARMPATN